MLYKFLIFFLSCFFSISSYAEEIYREHMRQLISELKQNTKAEKIFITQNGNELYYRNGVLDSELFSLTQGTTQESLFYGYELHFNQKTSFKQQQELLTQLLPLAKKKKIVLTINYGKGEKKRKEIQEKSRQFHFIGELLPSLEADEIYSPAEDFHSNKVSSLQDVKNFLCLLNPEKYSSLEDYYHALKATEFDLLLIEPSFQGVFFSKEQIKQLKKKPSGQQRLVIAYFSIGEAEEYRYYWKETWKKKKPLWLVQENPDWKGNYIVKYWHPEWKKILKDYQKKLDDIEVDGYLLDTVDTFYYFED